MELMGVTMMVRVPQGQILAAEQFYRGVFCREPDFQPSDGFREWEMLPNVWLLVAEGHPPQNGRIRWGTAQIETERKRLQNDLAVVASPIEILEGIVAWCNFDDPWGNQLGLFQDLQRWGSI